jgi:alpha-ribazole phosphatase
MKTFKLHLIRHGLTSGNLQGLYIGSGTDIPLCDEGRAQLAELKERFEYPQVDTVFSSPLMRAVETANILFPNATHQFSVHDLREAGFGVFENHPVKELVKNEDFKKWITPGSGFVPEGAEPTEQFHARCSETLLKLFEYMIRMDVTEAACVTHGGVIMTILSAYGIPKAGFYDWIVGNGCGYSVRITPGLWMRDKVMEVYAKVPKDLDEEQDGDLKYIRNIVREAADRAYGTGETGKKT